MGRFVLTIAMLLPLLLYAQNDTVDLSQYRKRIFKKDEYIYSPNKIKISIPFLDQFLTREPRLIYPDPGEVPDSSVLFILHKNKSVHQIQLDNYIEQFNVDSTYRLETQWDGIQRMAIKEDKSRTELNNRMFEVYGVHPFWMGTAYKSSSFSPVSRGAYFGYNIDPNNGSDVSSPGIIQAQSWSKTPLISMAKKYGVAVDLVVSSYGYDNNEMFFSDKKALVRKTVIDSIERLTVGRGGVCLDIQQVPSSCQTSFISFIRDLKQAFVANDVGNKREITLVLPKVDVGYPYAINDADWQLLDPVVDRCVLVGTDPYLSGNLASGDSSIKYDNLWDFKGIEAAIRHYPAGMFSKMLLEIPLYETNWVVSKADTVLKVIPFREIGLTNPDFVKTFTIGLKEKLVYVQNKGLKGVALWATGYDYGFVEIQQMLKEFAAGEIVVEDEQANGYMDSLIQASIDAIPQILPDGTLVLAQKQDSIAEIEVSKESMIEQFINQIRVFAGDILPEDIRLPGSSPVLKESKFKKEKSVVQHIVVLCLAVLLFFALVGFVIAMFFEAAREVMFSKDYLFYLLGLIMVVAAVFLLNRVEIVNSGSLLIILGLVAIIAVLLVRRWKRAAEQDELKP